MQRQRILLLFALAGLAAGFLPGRLTAQGPVGPAVVRLYFHDPAHLQAVAGGLDIWEVHAAAGYAVAAVSPEQYRRLAGLGYRLEVDAEKTSWFGIESPLDPRFHYFDDDYPNANGLYVVDLLTRTANISYTHIAELVDIGDAWQAGNGGYHRDIWALRITSEDEAYGPIEDKPPFLLFGNIHAREVATPELVIRYVKYLTSGYRGLGGYGVDPDVTWLVDWHVVYLVVMLNPDGHRIDEEETSLYRRKNMDSDDGCSSSFDWGVDLNRNFGFMWACCGGSSPDPCSETYHGPARASEPETIAMQEFLSQTVFQDWNGPNGDDEIPPAAPEEAAGVSISLHQYSDLVIWPWGWLGGPTPNDAQITVIGRKLGYYTGFTPLSAAEAAPTGGGILATDGMSEDWIYGKFGVPAYLFEVGPSGGDCGGFYPPYECIDGDEGLVVPRKFWPETRRAFVFAHKIARTPYVTAYGPDAAGLAVSPNPVWPGAPVQLGAYLQDHRYGSDPLAHIGAAEYFVDQPGADGTGMPMAPQDGSWGGYDEYGVAVVDTAALAPGRHYLLVHARKLETPTDYWGPFTAVFLDVRAGTCAGVEIQGVTAQADGCVVAMAAAVTGTLPVTYAWDFGAWGASSAPTPTVDFGATGTYPYTLTATNCDGLGGDVFSGTVAVTCCREVADADLHWAPPAPTLGQAVVFTGTATGTLPISYSWAFGDGDVGTGAVVEHTYAAAGRYTVTLEAANCGGQGITATARVLTVTCPGVHDVGLSWAPPEPAAGAVVVFTGTASSTLPLSFSWSFGDGAEGSGGSVTHTYAAAGSYALLLTATNACGGSASAGGTVMVWPACAPVQILDVTLGITGCTVAWGAELTGTAPFVYRWDFGAVGVYSDARPAVDFPGTGTYTGTLDVWNCAAAGHAARSLAVAVECGGPRPNAIYLPLVVK